MSEPNPATWQQNEQGNLATSGWIGLYLLSLMAEIPTFIARFLCTYIAIQFFELIATGHWNTSLANRLCLVFPVAMIAWSASALIHPFGAGSWLRESMGARHPTSSEAQAYEDAIANLELPPDVKLPRHWWVLDENTLNACVLGDTLVINRELLDTGWLEPVLAHELGHLNSPDARVTVAINRLAAIAIGLRDIKDSSSREPREPGNLAWFLGLIVKANSGAIGAAMMTPAWAGWWRLREYAADQYAAQLGQAEHLANFLETHGLLYDTPIRFPMFSDRSHPPVALRIDHLRQWQTTQ